MSNVTVPEVRTERLLLRGWRDDDREAWAAINADPVVRATLGPPQTREQSDASIVQMIADWSDRGFGWWCVDLDGECIGLAGLNQPSFEVPFMRRLDDARRSWVEVGWRLAADRWGHGFASEAAQAALAFGFGELGRDEVVAFTADTNVRSRAVMERLGMTHDADDDFDHPYAPPALRRHVVYRLPFTTTWLDEHRRHAWRR